MPDVESTLIILIDADDVKFAFSGWPDHICLAACLSSDGTCSMIVFRRDERDEIPARLLKVLRLKPSQVCFVPQISGYRTKQFLYSDERRLMALVASDPVILEEATDYAVNYNYALEEGLDPAVLLGLQPASDVAPAPMPQYDPATRSTEADVNPLLPDFLRRSVERSRRPTFSSRRRASHSVLAQA
tara:strand:+ start:5993 stop:6553 length:561 start_codon:yes stop_codon:yes gene_type:complete